jgi:hypothetical protein
MAMAHNPSLGLGLWRTFAHLAIGSDAVCPFVKRNPIAN